MFKNNLELCIKARTICHNNNGKTLNYLQTILNRPCVYNLDPNGINNFFDDLRREIDLSKDNDYSIMNNRTFKWKDLNDFEYVYEFINKVQSFINNDAFNKFSRLVETHK